MENQNFLPNTTQIPNVIIDELLPRLKETEFKVLIIVARQTLGWIADKQTGRRKELDWISNGQLMQKTGKSRQALNSAVQRLIELGVIEVYSERGELLDTGVKRTMAGSRLYYRLSTNSFNLSLFTRHPAKILRGKNFAPTKVTDNTKEINKGSGYVDKAKRRLQELKAPLLQKTI